MLVIGRNDRGVVNAPKVLEDNPNKVRDILGIMVDVNLRVEAGKEALEIVAKPYHYRTLTHRINRYRIPTK